MIYAADSWGRENECCNLREGHDGGVLEALDRRHRDALHRAGRDVGHSNSLRTLLPRWFAHRFGGFGSLTGISGSHPSGKERTLAERDTLAK